MKERLPEPEFPGENTLRMLLNDMNEMFVALNLKLRITYANRKFLSLLGYEMKEIIGRPLEMILTADAACASELKIEQVIEEQAAGEFMSRFKTKNGLRLEIRAMAAPLLEDGQVSGISIVAEDVTEFMRQKEEVDWRQKRMDIISGCMLDVMIKLDMDLNVEYVTPSVKKATGYDPDLLVGMSIFTLIHPADRRVIREAAMERISLQESLLRRCRLRHKDGHYIWMEAGGSPLIDETGQINGFIVSARDVTARVEYEQALLKSRRNFQSLFDSMQEGFALWKAVRNKQGQIRDYRCADANPTFLRATRLTREKLIGQLNSKTHPRLDEEWMEMLGEVVASGQSRSFEGYSREMNRHFDIYAFRPGKDLLACLFVDATRRIASERQMAEDRNWLSVVLKSVNEGIIATDVSGKVLFLNQKAAGMMGWAEAEATGQHLSELFSTFNSPPGSAGAAPAFTAGDEMLSAAEADNTGDKPLTFDDNIIILNREGHKHIISNSSAPISNQDGETLGVVMVLTDITDQRAALEKIEYLSFNDALTGLYNRAYVEQVTSSLLEEKDLPLGIILGDVNGLKLTNDVFGHLEGDRLLQKTAAVLQDSCRDSDIIARWGGDEFLIVLPRSGTDVAAAVCERIQHNCKAAGEDPIEISISLGFAAQTSVEQSVNDIFRQAEDQMYENKLKEKESSRGAIIASLERNLWRRSFESPEHNHRVRDLALKLAWKLGIEREDQGPLALLASLHDIGKVGIESEVLTKSGPLTAEETELMRKHSEIGYRMADAIPELKPLAEYILFSHENWDGSGYPRGLKGEEIPLMSRIIHIVHSYDIAAYGVYKAARGLEAARQQIIDGKGKQYDPRLADLLAEVLDAEEREQEQELVKEQKQE